MPVPPRRWFHPHRRLGWVPIVMAIGTVVAAFVSRDWRIVVFGITITLLSLWRFRQAFAELVSMPLLRWFFKMQSVGPGVEKFPTQGPVLVIANHASHFDPPILAHELPRPVTGVMTSDFYDRWYFFPLAKWVWNVIRVPSAVLKTETPEVDSVVKALDQSKCVIFFPEGWLRRKEDVPVKRFGQGVWRILCQRPDTIIVPCWIEGMWGSRFSHKDGPPGGTKPRDRGRPIVLAVGEPFTIDPALLDDHLATRFALMEKVLACRSHLPSS